MKRFQPITLIFTIIIISLHFVGCRNTNINSPLIFNFGDSHEDTGGYIAATGMEVGYPYGRAIWGRPMGRATDGRVVIDFLCESVGANYLNPYLDSMENNFANGVNFAVSGGCTLPRNVLFNLNIQILQFKRFYNRSIELHSKGLMNMAGEENFKNALYVFEIGGNDLTALFADSTSYAQIIDKIPSIISEIKDAILAIHQLGGKNFWVHNTWPSGCSPGFLSQRANYKGGTEYDEHGCIKFMIEGAKAFNARLYDLCQELRSQVLKGSNIVYVDVFSIKYDLIANAPSYGFDYPLMACCGSGGPPYNVGVMCSMGEYTVCEKGERYISWDGTHYTDYANSITASKILSTNYSTPPLKFNFFCNNTSSRVSSSS